MTPSSIKSQVKCDNLIYNAEAIATVVLAVVLPNGSNKPEGMREGEMDERQRVREREIEREKERERD